MVSHYHCALFSKLVYESPEYISTHLPEGWRLAKHTEIKRGYFAAVFISGNNLILAHRGTDEAVDSVSNILIYLNTIPTQAIIATYFTDSVVDEHSNKRITHTGHSLGGAIAELIALKTGTKAISFDAPGIKKIADKFLKFIPHDLTQITSYLAAPNLVNSVGEHITDPIMIRFLTAIQPGIGFVDYIQYSLDQHSIETISAQFITTQSIPISNQNVASWPSSISEGYKCFVDFSCNSEYLTEYLRQEWNKNPIFFQLNSKKDDDFETKHHSHRIKNAFANFGAFKKYMVKNGLDDHSEEITKIEAALNDALHKIQNSKHSKIFKALSDGLKFIFAPEETIEDYAEEICAESHDPFIMELCGVID